MTRRLVRMASGTVPVVLVVVVGLISVSATKEPSPRLLELGPHVGATLDSVGLGLGRAQAPVVVRVVGDYECAACEALDRGVGQTLRSWARAGRIRYLLVQAPLTHHRRAPKAAIALRCAEEQGAAWPMHNLLVDGRAEWGWGSDPADTFHRYSGQLALDEASFRACLTGLDAAQHVAKSREAAQRMGIEAVPLIMVGNTLFRPARSFDELLAYVEAALDRTAGTSRATP